MTVLLEEKLEIYDATGEYKGFYVVIEEEVGHMTHLTFTNEFQEVSASGIFKSEALKRAFSKIDECLSN